MEQKFLHAPRVHLSPRGSPGFNSIQPYRIRYFLPSLHRIVSCNACLLQDHAMPAWIVVASIANCEVRSGFAEYELQDGMTWGSDKQLGLKKPVRGNRS
jgi:hypothetical protein